MKTKIIIRPEEENEELDNQELEQPEETEPEQQKIIKKPKQVSLKARRGIDGRLMITDHDHIDIIFLPKIKKVFCSPKNEYSDLIYDTQIRLFKFLSKKGLISPESIQGSNIYGCLEARLLDNRDNVPLEHLLVLNIEKWLDAERPALEMDKLYSQEMTNPSDEDSTELGEVPHEEVKGSIPKNPKRYVGGWW